ncbi:Coq4 family protein [Nostoc sp. FACHB-190]|uniref:Coq4 family protein n=1 Tax=Nostoc sp. FACHB-190 TaxID=2692838 RepID=UPI0016830165|nr:Coq4 family protein [Nostoc sp. FACHB-190]MBD2301763.1 hypothetical protein [Nostoc sp. FACHB-190]
MFLKDLRGLNLEFLNTLKGAITLFIDPGRADATPDIEDGMINIKATKLAIEYIKSKPEVTQIIQERYIAPPPDMEAIGKCPEGSLGYAFAKYIKDTGFDPNYYRGLKITDDTSYILHRLRQTHDIWHVVTGLGFDVNGELGLQAFCLAQIRIPLPIILLAGGLMRTLINAPEQMDNLLTQIAIGYRMGAKAKPLIAQKWEENWNKPLSQWRSDLGIEPTSVYIP